MSRSFTVTHILDRSGKIDSEYLGGRYISSQPSAAAKKAAHKICQSKGTKGSCSFIIFLKETTQGSSKKTYKYKVKRIKSDRTVVRQGVEIHYQYQFMVKSYKDYPNIVCEKNKSINRSR